MTDLTGQSIGRYILNKIIAEDDFTRVYSAFDSQLKTEIAIKFILTDQLTSQNATLVVKRFTNFAKSIKNLDHPNILKVNDLGLFKNEPYFVMPIISTSTLKQRIGTPTDWVTAVRLIIPLARTLEYAHSRDFIHTDVKPTNIIITDFGELKITDFGIAKILDLKEGQTRFRAVAGVGNPEYMAPEQWKGNSSPSVDVYALGVIFYELLTGKKPFAGENSVMAMINLLNDPLPKITEFAPDVPKQVEQVVYRALEKQPEDRYQSMKQFEKALKGLIEFALETKAKEITKKKKELIIQKTKKLYLKNQFKLSDAIRKAIVLIPFGKNNKKPNPEAVKRISTQKLTRILVIGGVIGCFFIVTFNYSRSNAKINSQIGILIETPTNIATKQEMQVVTPDVNILIPTTVQSIIHEAIIDKIICSGANVVEGQYIENGTLINSGQSIVSVRVTEINSNFGYIYLYPNSSVEINFGNLMRPKLISGAIYLIPGTALAVVDLSNFVKGLSAYVSEGSMAIEYNVDEIHIYCIEGKCVLEPIDASEISVLAGSKKIFNIISASISDSIEMTYSEKKDWVLSKDSFCFETLTPASEITPTSTFSMSNTEANNNHLLSPTLTPSVVVTLTQTKTTIKSVTPTVSRTPTSTLTPSVVVTLTSTKTMTKSVTPTVSRTPTLTLTVTTSATFMASTTFPPTSTRTTIPTGTLTRTLTKTPTKTTTSRTLFTPSATPTPIASPVGTSTGLPTPTNIVGETDTPQPTSTSMEAPTNTGNP